MNSVSARVTSVLQDFFKELATLFTLPQDESDLLLTERLSKNSLLTRLDLPIPLYVAQTLIDFVEKHPDTSFSAPHPDDPTFEVASLLYRERKYEMRREARGSFSLYMDPPLDDDLSYIRRFSSEEITRCTYGEAEITVEWEVVTLTIPPYLVTIQGLIVEDDVDSDVDLDVKEVVIMRSPSAEEPPLTVKILQEKEGDYLDTPNGRYLYEAAYRRLYQSRLGCALSEMFSTPKY